MTTTAVPHCHRCGSHNCICDPTEAATATIRLRAPCGPPAARAAFTLAQQPATQPTLFETGRP